MTWGTIWSESIIFVPQTLNYLFTNSFWDSKMSFLELGLVESCRLGDIYGFPKTGWAEIDIMFYFCSSNRWDFCDHFIVPLSRTCHVIGLVMLLRALFLWSRQFHQLCPTPVFHVLSGSCLHVILWTWQDFISFPFSFVFLSSSKLFFTDENFKFTITNLLWMNGVNSKATDRQKLRNILFTFLFF